MGVHCTLSSPLRTVDTGRTTFLAKIRTTKTVSMAGLGEGFLLRAEQVQCAVRLEPVTLHLSCTLHSTATVYYRWIRDTTAGLARVQTLKIRNILKFMKNVGITGYFEPQWLSNCALKIKHNNLINQFNIFFTFEPPKYACKSQMQNG